MSIVVVLPAPFGPRKATTSPWRHSMSTPSTAVKPRKRLVSPVASIAASGALPARVVVTGCAVCVSSMSSSLRRARAGAR